ncbi:hypothetical protein [Alicyclobacillus sp. SO9]|uniref:hypothetical protein n=1 Tax=Alicyclobacillus sp. SO9 TaxID=2665646 RepID=UPI0018E86AF3|nr:hypothetical protein [Alicyclobacillus sp. SO9]QQE76938.1 hypothetical protein GI364_13130 [Alicyclobacillus sp. SO9]
MIRFHGNRARTVLGLVVSAVLTMSPMSLVVQAATTGTAVTQEDVFVVPDSSHKTINIVNKLQIKAPSSLTGPVVLKLPKTAQNVHVTAASKPVSIASGAHTVKLPHVSPGGSTNVVESYSIPLTSQGDVQFTLQTSYPVYTAHVYLPLGQHASLSAQGLMTHTQTMTVKGVEFRVFTRPSIPAGDSWTLSVQMLPSAAVNSTVQNLPVIGTRPDNFLNTLQAVGNLLVAALVLVVGLISIRATQWGRAARVPVTKEEALLRSWENLELQHENGTLGEAEYRTRREYLKQRILALKSGAPS